LKRKSKY